jgi:hypothetical protein
MTRTKTRINGSECLQSPIRDVQVDRPLIGKTRRLSAWICGVSAIRNLSPWGGWKSDRDNDDAAGASPSPMEAQRGERPNWAGTDDERLPRA